MSTVLIKHSLAAGNSPLSLLDGELAINEADELLFYKNSSGAIRSFSLPSAPMDALAYSGLQNNGAMTVSQQFAGVATTGMLNTNRNVVDGWYFGVIGAAVLTGQQVADAPPGYINSVKATVTTADATMAAGSYAYIGQRIEGFRTASLAFGTASKSPIAIGFWVKANRVGTYSGAVRNSAFNRSYPFPFTINASLTWEFKTVTIPGDSTGAWLTNNGVGLELDITIASGSTFRGTANTWAAANLLATTGTINGVAATSDTFQLTGVVVIPGTTVPSAARAPFIMRSYDQELMAVKRYYQVSYYTPVGYDFVSAAAWYKWTFPTTMRAAPTFLVVSGGWVNSVPNVYPSISGILLGNTGSDFWLQGTSGAISISVDSRL